MVCCKAFPNVEIWQRVDFVADWESVERGVHDFACPVPACEGTVELDTSEIKRQIAVFASDMQPFPS
jgi:hypothetical protein